MFIATTLIMMICTIAILIPPFLVRDKTTTSKFSIENIQIANDRLEEINNDLFQNSEKISEERRDRKELLLNDLQHSDPYLDNQISINMFSKLGAAIVILIPLISFFLYCYLSNYK